MKKTIVLSFIFLLSMASSRIWGMVIIPPTDTKAVATLVVNANVTVVLVNNPKAALQVSGNKTFMKFVKVKQTGSVMVISASRGRDLKDAGIIYVPASQVNMVEINCPAFVKSLNAMNVPILSVVVNGACKLAVSNIGEVNIVETDSYAFETSVEIRRMSESALIGKNN